MAQLPGTHPKPREERYEGAIAKTPILVRLTGLHDGIKFGSSKVLWQVGVLPATHSRNRPHQLRWSISFADHEAKERAHCGHDPSFRSSRYTGFPQDKFGHVSRS